MIRPYEPSDYSTIEEWASEHKVPAPPIAMLPQHGIVSYRYPQSPEDPIAAAWVYFCEPGVGFLHWLTAQPGLQLPTLRDAVGEILEGLKEAAAAEGVHTLFTHIHDPAITREALNNFGWQMIGYGTTLYLPKWHS